MKTYPLYLNGRWVTSEKTIAVADPATGKVFAQAATVDRAGVRQALADAQAALPAWASADLYAAR